MSRRKNMFILFSIILLALVMLTTVMDGTEIKSPQSSQTTTKAGTDLTKNNEDPGTESKKLIITLAMEPDEFSLVQRFTQEFEAEHSGVFVILENIAKSEIYGIYKTRAQLGNTSDVMLLDNIWINEFAALGYLSHRIDEFFSSELQSQQIQAMMSQVKWNGYIWGVPKDVDPYVLVWNKARFSEKSIDHPPATAEELISLNHLFRESDIGNYGLYVDPTDPYAFISLIWSMGGAEMNLNNKVVTLNDPNTIQLLESFFSTENVSTDKQGSTDKAVSTNKDNSSNKDNPTSKPISSPSINQYPDFMFNSWEMLAEGKIAMMITKASLFKKHMTENMKMIPLPNNPKNEKTAWLNGRSFVVSAHTAFAKEAYEWIQALTLEDKQIEMMRAGGGFPAIGTAYKDGKLDSMDQSQVISRSIDQGTVMSAEPMLPQKMMILQLEMGKLFQGEVSIKDFTDNINEQWLSIDKK